MIIKQLHVFIFSAVAIATKQSAGGFSPVIQAITLIYAFYNQSLLLFYISYLKYEASNVRYIQNLCKQVKINKIPINSFILWQENSRTVLVSLYRISNSS